jgi:hypothetical protein
LRARIKWNHGEYGGHGGHGGQLVELPGWNDGIRENAPIEPVDANLLTPLNPLAVSAVLAVAKLRVH